MLRFVWHVILVSWHPSSFYKNVGIFRWLTTKLCNNCISGPLAPANFLTVLVAPKAVSFIFTNNSLADQYLVTVDPRGDGVECTVTSTQGNKVSGDIRGLSPGTSYTLTLMAKSGVWSSEPYTVTVSTNETGIHLHIS